MDIKERIDNMTDAEVKAALKRIWDVSSVCCAFCPEKQNCGIDTSRDSDECFNRLVKEARK